MGCRDASVSTPFNVPLRPIAPITDNNWRAGGQCVEIDSEMSRSQIPAALLSPCHPVIQAGMVKAVLQDSRLI
jgi:hypothetical protein